MSRDEMRAGYGEVRDRGRFRVMTTPLDLPTARRRYVAAALALFWLPQGLTTAPHPALHGTGHDHGRHRGPLRRPLPHCRHARTARRRLSDVFGRRAVLAAAGLLNLTALTLQALGTTAWVLTLGMVLMGTARALSSGPAEAWYVDTVHAHAGPDAELRTGLAAAAPRGPSAALATGTLLGGALPWLLGLGPDLGAGLSGATSGLVLPLSVPLLLGAVVDIAFVLYVLTALREPAPREDHLRDVLQGVRATVVGGLRLGARDALVRRVFLSAGTVGCALAALELLTPGRAAALTGASESGAVLYAVIACLGFVSSGVGSHLAPLTARLAGGAERGPGEPRRRGERVCSAPRRCPRRRSP